MFFVLALDKLLFLCYTCSCLNIVYYVLKLVLIKSFSKVFSLACCLRILFYLGTENVSHIPFPVDYELLHVVNSLSLR